MVKMLLRCHIIGLHESAAKEAAKNPKHVVVGYHEETTHATDTTPSTTIQAAWSDAARAAALEARKHGSYAEYSDDAHEASKRALDLSRTAQGHHQDRRAHREAAEAHENASIGHSYAGEETSNHDLVKHHEAHADFHQSMAQAHKKLHDSMGEHKSAMQATEITAATDLIQAALQPDANTIRAHWHIEKKGDKWHVVKANGQDEGESDSEEMAKKHLAALYANAPETKASEHYDENWNLKATWSDAAREAEPLQHAGSTP